MPRPIRRWTSSGSDAAQKLAILAHLAFGARVHWSEIPRIGIDTLDSADMRYAKELGYRIKLIAVAQLPCDSGLELHVSPTLVKIGTPLAEVRGAFNAIAVVGDAVGPVFFHGLGAGQMPTASAVVADMIDTVVGRTGITFRTLELWSQDEARVATLDHKQLAGPLLLAVHGRRPTRACWPKSPACWASIRFRSPRSFSTSRAATARDAVVPLVIMTQQAKEGAAQAAVAEIDRLKCVRPSSVRMRVLD